jgi:hypothetical protein
MIQAHLFIYFSMCQIAPAGTGVKKSGKFPSSCTVIQKIIVCTGQTSQMLHVGLNITDIIETVIPSTEGNKCIKYTRFEVLKEVKISVFLWVVMLCGLVDRYQHFRETCFLHL